MLHSPQKKDSLHSSSPNLLSDKEHASSEESITQRLKRRRCECGSDFNDESKLDKFINTLTTWRQETDARLSDIQISMQDVLKQNAEILTSQVETEKSIEFLSLKYDDLLTQLNTQQNKIQSSHERICKVADITEEMDRRSRLSSIEIRNIQLSNKNSTQDDLVSAATRVLEELSINVTTSDIYDIRRLPSKTNGFTAVCTLNSVILKNKALKAFRDYNKSNPSNKLNSTILGGPQQPIYIAEHLTAQARRLYYLAREYAKTENYKHCWTSSGRVLLRKADNTKLIVVTSETQLVSQQAKN